MPAPPGLDGPERLAAVIAAQESAGLELLTDGVEASEAGEAGIEVVARWQVAAGFTDRADKQVLRGPWSAALRAAESPTVGSRGGRDGTFGGRASERDVGESAERLRETVLELAAAGCPLAARTGGWWRSPQAIGGS